jgi:uncharacterized membrane protein
MKRIKRGPGAPRGVRIMMKTFREHKERAKQSLHGRFGRAAGGTLLAGLVCGVPFCQGPMQAGYAHYGTKLIRGEDPKISDAFESFNYFGKSLWLFMITSFFLSLWSLLFVIPGIIKSFSYALAPFIWADNPALTAREAPRESRRAMHGKKGRLFLLSLSFIGWYSPGAVSLGIGFLWITPYFTVTLASFYEGAAVLQV